MMDDESGTKRGKERIKIVEAMGYIVQHVLREGSARYGGITIVVLMYLL